jgi:cytochrome c1
MLDLGVLTTSSRSLRDIVSRRQERYEPATHRHSEPKHRISYWQSILKGLNYNPYFPGGAIAMAKQLQDGQVEYEDGTPATASQMAKDVAMFLAWAAEPEHDERKKSGIQWTIAIITALAISGACISL